MDVRLIILSLVLMVFSCTEDNAPKLPSADERSEEAKQNLINELSAPANGWRLEYQPTPTSGVYLILMDFSPGGEVTIKSDVSENDGEFFTQTIPYRIDRGLGLELILETYGVFHFLFEQNSASFGAEFEFIFINKNGADLIFQSATDLNSAPTIITFQPADSNDENELAREVSANLNEFPTEISQQLIFDDAGISIFWQLNSIERTVRVNSAAVGTSIADIVAVDENIKIEHTSGYLVSNGSLELLTPFNFILNGTFYTVERVFFNDFNPEATPGFCTLTPELLPEYEGSVSGIGAFRMISSVFDLGGTAFQPLADVPYSVNIPFIFDGDGFSLANDGAIINEKFPNATGFIFYYGNQVPGEPEYGAGFFLTNSEGGTDIFVREFLPTNTTDGNKVTVSFTNNFSNTGNTGLEDEANLTEITNLIFQGTELYAQEFPVEGLQVFILYNPCNNFQVFLVG